MAYKIKENIFSIKTPLEGSPLKWINNFLIKGKERNLLIDTAFNRPECLNAISEGLKENGAELENTDIFLTHMHADHAGLCAKLKINENKIYAGEKDAFTVNNLNNPAHWEFIGNTSLFAGIKEEFVIPYYEHVAYLNRPEHKVDFTIVKEGDILNYGRISFKAVDLKGHTPGQMGLYSEKEGILICGDHILDKITPHITCWDLENDYLGMYLDNLKKVRSYNIKLLLSGHRELCQNPYERIDFLIDHHQKRLKEVYEIIKENPWYCAFETAGKMTWQFRKTFDEFPKTQKWFASSEALAHLQYLYFRGILERKEENKVCLYKVKG